MTKGKSRVSGAKRRSRDTVRPREEEELQHGQRKKQRHSVTKGRNRDTV